MCINLTLIEKGRPCHVLCNIDFMVQNIDFYSGKVDGLFSFYLAGKPLMSGAEGGRIEGTLKIWA